MSDDIADDIAAYIKAVEAAGGTVSEKRRAQIETLIRELKATGLWVKLDQYWDAVADNEIAAVTSIKQNGDEAAS